MLGISEGSVVLFTKRITKAVAQNSCQMATACEKNLMKADIQGLEREEARRGSHL